MYAPFFTDQGVQIGVIPETSNWCKKVPCLKAICFVFARSSENKVLVTKPFQYFSSTYFALVATNHDLLFYSPIEWSLAESFSTYLAEGKIWGISY